MPKSIEQKMEEQQKFDNLPEKEQSEIIEESHGEALKLEEYFGEMYPRLEKVGATKIAQRAMELLEHYNGHGYTEAINDIYINEKEKIAAILLQQNSWGSMGGVQWDKDLLIQKGDERAEIYFSEVRARSGSEQDMEYFWYVKIQEINYKKGKFIVDFGDDMGFHGEKMQWNLDAGKKYSVRAKSHWTEPHPNIEEQTLEYKIIVPGKPPVYEEIPYFEKDKSLEALRKKYGSEAAVSVSGAPRGRKIESLEKYYTEIADSRS